MQLRAPLVAAAALLAALAVAAGAAAAAPPPAAPLLAFPGLDANQLPGVNPADVQVTAGSGFVAETVNSSIAIWSVSGTAATQVSNEPLGVFFSGSGVDRSNDDMTDPRVLFDQVSGRWFAVVFDISRRELDVAVSQTAAPNGAWTVYSLPSTGCPDQPRLGSSDAVVVVTDDLFSSCRGSGRFLGGEVIVLSKPDLLAGVASPRKASFGPDERFAAVTPAVSLGSTAREYLVAVEQAGTGIQLIHVDGTDMTTLPFVTVDLPTLLQDPPAAPQRGSDQLVDSGDNRVQNAIWEQGRIWLTSAATCPAAPRSCGRVIQLDATAGKLVRDTTIALPGSRFLFYPAIAPDARGNAVVAFGYASPTDFPGLGYTYVRPDGAVAAPVDVAAGSSPNDSGRFGDYSGAARDGVDASRIWIAAEIGQASDGTSLGWGSQVAAVSVPPQAPAVATTSARVAGDDATVTAELYPEGAPTSYQVEYGPTAAYGATTRAASIAATPRAQTVTALVPGLRAGSAYHLRLVATSPNGTSDGPDVVVRAPALAPTVATRAARRAGATAVLRALVAPRGATTAVSFQYGRTRSYGARTRARRLGAAAGPTLVSVPVRLVRGRRYHYRAVATSARGRAVGADRTIRG
ncbi:MAG TPA: fibronectin type III domain-containing protein [Gaiellaceae bacterium]|nr:fibronectin type III domain-containing protein [Gaiellaceae bacterium]